MWDAAEGCEHVWGVFIDPKTKPNWDKFDGGSGLKRQGAKKVMQGQFCQLCGAWHGQLGLEPTIELYLDHLLQITDTECGRVLKDSRVMVVNMGDSYATHASKRSGQFGKEIKEGFDDVFTRTKEKCHYWVHSSQNESHKFLGKGGDD